MQIKHFSKVTFFVFLFFTVRTQAEAPAGYYSSAAGLSGNQLRTSLHLIIDGHTPAYYGNSDEYMETIDAAPGYADRVKLVYSRRIELGDHFIGNGNPTPSPVTAGWNREHLWPNSYGIDGIEPLYSDLFNLRPSDVDVNSARGNLYFDLSSAQNGGLSVPAHSEAPLCSKDNVSWEPPAELKGDIARSMFYMDIRYEGDAGENNLKLTDNTALITSYNAYMGKLSTLLLWHYRDPVSFEEQARNDAVYRIQGNRNPFIDHPEWVENVYNRYQLTVHNGSGSGLYAAGTTVPIKADAIPTGKNFTGWKGDVDFVQSLYSTQTEVVMPSQAVDITAFFVYSSTEPTGVLNLGERQPIFKWPGREDAEWYHIWIERIGEGKVASKWIKAPIDSWHPDFTFQGGTYKWWFAGWNQNGYSSWSGSYSFTVHIIAPEQPKLISPNDSEEAEGILQYTWKHDGKAQWYNIWIGQGCTPFYQKWHKADSIASGQNCKISVPDHRWGSYHWYVRGWNLDGLGEWSTAGQFISGRPIPTTSSLNQLDWSDTNCSSANWYQVWINKITASSDAKERAWWFRQHQTQSSGDTNRSITIDPALESGDYNWAIRAWHSTYGTGPWSTVEGFTVP